MRKLILSGALAATLTACNPCEAVSQMEHTVTLTILAEARGEGEIGMEYVGQSILLRSRSRGLTPDQVCKQPLQYSCWNGRGPQANILLEDPEITMKAQAIAILVCAGVDVAPGNFDHYINPDKCDPEWSWYPKASKKVGRHLFLEL